MMNNADTLGLYIHVPFCTEKCAYCDFYSLKDNGSMDAYVKALRLELDAWSVPANTKLVDTIYFGGGTPSCLGGVRLQTILDHVRARFAVASDAEITVECNPESTSETLLRNLWESGVNRLSFGVQSADAKELRRLGRLHSFAQAAWAVTLAQKLGFDNISVDLMYGLPQQNWNTLRQSVQQLLSLSPAHISAYSLKLEQGTPMGAEDPVLPDGDLQAEWFLEIGRMLRDAGFVQYEISNFARSGKESRHNQKYWDFSAYLGLGPGAHSFFGGTRFYNKPNLRTYCKDPLAVRETESQEGITLDDYVMLSLRTAKGISLKYMQTQFGVDSKRLQAEIAPLIKQGLAIETADGFRLTQEGFLVSSSVILYVSDAATPLL